MRVAVGQFASVDDRDLNLTAIDRLLARAAEADAEIAVLPEYAMEPFGAADSPPARGEPIDGPFASALVERAVRHGLTIVAWMTEAPPEGTLPYNTLVVVNRDGLVGRYRKVHLFDAFGGRESQRLRPGDPSDVLTIDVAGLRIGLLTCYDLRFPEMARVLVDHGAEVLIVPAAWVAGPLKEHQWATLLTARAIENTCWVVGAGQSPPLYTGRSQVVDPMGVAVASLGAQNEDLLIADIDNAAVASARLAVPSLSHRRFTVTPH